MFRIKFRTGDPFSGFAPFFYFQAGFEKKRRQSGSVSLSLLQRSEQVRVHFTGLGLKPQKQRSSCTEDYGSYLYVEGEQKSTQAVRDVGRATALRDGSVWGAGDNRNEALSATTINTTTAAITGRSEVFYPRCPRPSFTSILLPLFDRSAPRRAPSQRRSCRRRTELSCKPYCLPPPSLARCGRPTLLPPPCFEVLKIIT